MSVPAGLAVRNLCVARGGRQILHRVSFQVPPGSVTAIVGPSGVGKTTLMHVLNGLLVPSAGQVALDGIGDLAEAAHLRAARAVTATVFQDHALIGRLDALDNVLLGLADRRHPFSLLPWPRAMREAACRVLDEVGLLARAGERVERLSGGERQRVGLARALVRRPSLLLGDEPFASVDPLLAEHLGALLRDLAARRRVTVVLVLHQLALARGLADRIVGLSAGRVVFDGAASEFGPTAEARVFRPPSDTSPIPFIPQRKDASCFTD